MSATSTPQFFTTAYPSVTQTGTATPNMTTPIIIVDSPSMSTTNALLGTTLALIAVAVALAAARYVPVSWMRNIKSVIPQSTIDSFKNDPMGSVSAMVKDPSSVLKSLKIPDSVKSVASLVPKSVKDKFVPESIQEMIAAPSSAKVPRIEFTPVQDQPTETKREEPVQEPEIFRQPSPEPPPPEEDKNTDVVDLGSGILQAPPRQTSAILQINSADLQAVQALLNSRNTEHTVLSG